MSRVEWERTRPLFEERPNVLSVWAFGSAQGGEIRPGGDLDVAVLFATAPSLDELADLRADLQQLLGQEDVDLVALNRAPSLLAFEAVSGRPFFCRDPGTRAVFVSLTARQYEDDRAFLERGLAAGRKEFQAPPRD
ncbi:MAG: nucleotidyltransferase domain-containing protein [Proteobacteria bacterium]|nr:nucleotidyltransferase domain-containing protein [Pseudomonadota bacterium]